MQNTTKRVAIYIGKFQPLHIAHIEIMEHCIKNYDELIVLVGSTNRRISINHPFSFQQVKSWIVDVNPNIIVKPIQDYIYNETKWITEVNSAVYGEFLGENVEFTLVGHHKDETSYYLDEFPNFKVEEMQTLENNLSGTFIRNEMFDQNNTHVEDIESVVSKKVAKDINDFMDTDDFENLVDEYNYYQAEKEMFKEYPFPATLKFNYSDAVVVCDGNVLLIERKINPGKGTWALPGGFVNQNETYQQAAIRELVEETGIKVPANSLKNAIKDSEVFDHPKRSIGIPRISRAYYFEVFPDKRGGYSKLPKVRADDDASEAKWFPISEVLKMKLFDDHSDIINYFTKY